MSDLRLPLHEPRLPPMAELLAQGKKAAALWQVGPCPFLVENGVACEAEHKRRAMADRRIMRHAQIGFRDPEKSQRAYREIWQATAKQGRGLDRYGLCCDFSMGYPAQSRKNFPSGTGMLLRGPEDFAALSASAPVAPHFGDFILGFPAALENTGAALAAGATTIGNLGQYFTYRLPNWSDDLGPTEATMKALGLIAAQSVEVLVHSNLDDGFAGLFSDLACTLGQALLERYILEELIGIKVTHCFGHHFSDPLTRLAFQRALALANPTPGSMVYGNTVGYRGSAAENWASLASYLSIDILAQHLRPSGHGVNAVPITENMRIPDIDEVIEAQLFAGRLIERLEEAPQLIDPAPADRVAEKLLSGAESYKRAVLKGLGEAGIDLKDAGQLLLALRRLGAKKLEEYFGPGARAEDEPMKRRPLVRATTFVELAHEAERRISISDQRHAAAIRERQPKIIVASSDVHEHGKLLVEGVLKGLGARILDGGISTDPEDLVLLAKELGAEAIALSTYNGIALSYVEALMAALKAEGLALPVLVGGRLNQVPSGSNSSLPVDVGAELVAAGAIVCRDLNDALAPLAALGKTKG